MLLPSSGTTTRPHLKAAAQTPQMKAVQANGALHLGAIKTFITEEVAIIP